MLGHQGSTNIEGGLRGLKTDRSVGHAGLYSRFLEETNAKLAELLVLIFHSPLVPGVDLADREDADLIRLLRKLQLLAGTGRIRNFC